MGADITRIGSAGADQESEIAPERADAEDVPHLVQDDGQETSAVHQALGVGTVELHAAEVGQAGRSRTLGVPAGLAENATGPVDVDDARIDQQIVDAGEIRNVRNDDLFPARGRLVEVGLIGRVAAVDDLDVERAVGRGGGGIGTVRCRRFHPGRRLRRKSGEADEARRATRIRRRALTFADEADVGPGIGYRRGRLSRALRGRCGRRGRRQARDHLETRVFGRRGGAVHGGKRRSGFLARRFGRCRLRARRNKDEQVVLAGCRQPGCDRFAAVAEQRKGGIDEKAGVIQRDYCEAFAAGSCGEGSSVRHKVRSAIGSTDAIRESMVGRTKRDGTCRRRKRVRPSLLLEGCPRWSSCFPRRPLL